MSRRSDRLRALVVATLLWVPEPLMARLITGGFETNGTTATEWTSADGTVVTAATTAPHSGTYCGSTVAQSFRRDLAVNKTSGTLLWRFLTKRPDATPGSNEIFARIRNSGASSALELTWTTTGAVLLTNKVTSTSVGTPAFALDNTWYRVEVRYLLADANGQMELRVFSCCGVVPLACVQISGEDTLSTNVQQFVLTSTAQAYFDDYAVNDDQGSSQNSWVGPGKFALLKPDTEVTAGWTPNTGTDNAALIDDVPGAPDDDTTYNSSSTIDVEDRLGLTALPAEVPSDATILLVHAWCVARGEAVDATARLRLLLWDEAGVQTPGPASNQNAATSYTFSATDEALVYDARAAGKTKADLAAFDVGYELLLADATRVTAVWVGVEWIEAGQFETARLFNGTDQSLQSASALNLTAHSKIAVSFWLYWDSFANNDDLALEFGDGGSVAGDFTIDPNSSDGTWTANIYGNVSPGSGAIARPSAAAWHHYVVNLDFTKAATLEVDSIYVDGVLQTFSSQTGPDNSGNFGNRTLYVMSRTNSTLFGAGRMAELAIYGGIGLVQADVTALYNGGAGALATSVQSGSLAHYWRLLGLSPEPATVGGTALTVNGATLVEHPLHLPLAVGRVVSAGPLSVPTGQYLVLQPAHGATWRIDNLYLPPAGSGYELEIIDGVGTSQKIDTLSGPAYGMRHHVTAARGLRVKNVSGATRVVGFDGIVTHV